MIFWRWVDQLTGANPQVDLDHAVRCRIALAFTGVFTLMSLVNTAMLAFVVEGRPGMVELGLGSALVAAVLGGVGLKLRRPNFTIALMIALGSTVIFLAAYANRGSFPPATLYVPGIVLGAYIAWGFRAVLAAIVPVGAYFAYIAWAAQQATGGELAFSPQEMLNILVAAAAFSCIWIILFGTSFRSAAQDAQDALARNNERLKTALKAAQAANRAKSEFIANMSHEVRTPLNGVLGMTSVMLQDGQLSNEHKHSLRLIDTSGKSLLGLLNDVLDLSKIEAEALQLETRDFDLIETLDASVAHWQAQAKTKGVDILVKREGAGDRLDVTGDPTRVRQVLNNLICNAVKFTHRGQITVSLNCGQLGDDGLIPLRITVKDTGIGIPRDKQDAIFDAFSQVDSSTTRKYGGTGLGLAICRRLLTMMGGRISVSSEPGRGSTFTVELALASGKAPVAVPASEALDTIVLDEPKRILVVDDVVTNQLVLRAMVEQIVKGDELVIDVASGGREAVNKATATNYDIILMDIQMPEMDGVSAMHCIRETRKAVDTQMVAVTALASEDHRRQFEAEGFVAYLPKPVELAFLRDVLARLLVPAEDDAPVQANRAVG
ncbi:MAG: ATP-binding protein [Alphaproteobacteria bacterium]|uniref:ATP-binding protein n=1 Tax=Maricaulis alexandrii TaxID=2570354 RepID=UPI0011098D01|nr:ATP-binding protein [Maricaulis alexandrii]MCR9267269.1 ATP-binding protein [Alphaproteobacteria bacterium]